jgi:hypothetical protein
VSKETIFRSIERVTQDSFEEEDEGRLKCLSFVSNAWPQSNLLVRLESYSDVMLGDPQHLVLDSIINKEIEIIATIKDSSGIDRIPFEVGEQVNMEYHPYGEETLNTGRVVYIDSILMHIVVLVDSVNETLVFKATVDNEWMEDINYSKGFPEHFYFWYLREN